jgi:GNAT superfamily N-acetyltransferase
VRIEIAGSDAEIDACFDAFQELRPHLIRGEFLSRVRRQQTQGYQVLALVADGRVPSAAGFRVGDFLAWGHILYVDDLTTMAAYRGRGYGEALMTWLIEYARTHDCDALHLDSGYARYAAHRLYLRKGLQLSSHHLAIALR